MGVQHYKRINEKILFIYNFLRGFFIMKVAENCPQNKQNCTLFKKILEGACPQTALATARSFAACDMCTQNSPNFKVAPRSRKILHTPLHYMSSSRYCIFIRVENGHYMYYKHMICILYQ